jgi:hypothetical protein
VALSCTAVIRKLVTGYIGSIPPKTAACMNQRPRTIWVVATFLFAATAIAVIVSVSLLSRCPFLDRLWELNSPAEGAFRAHSTVFGLLLLLLSASTFASGVGLLRQRRWAWWFAVVLFTTNGAGDLVSVGITGDWIRSASGVLICSAFLYLLVRAPVRRYFRDNFTRPF